MTDDDELREYVRSRVGDEFGLSAAQASRLRGATVRELRDDAKAMRSELGLEPLDQGAGAARDESGRFAGSSGAGVDMNAVIRRASGRVA